MTLLRNLLTGLALSLSLATTAFAAAPATSPPPAAPPAKKAAPAPPDKTAGASDKTAAAPAPAAPAAAPAAPPSTLDDYMKELTDGLKLSDSEKKQIEADYVKDGDTLKKILNDETLSPLQQAQKVSDLRDERNAKIVELLDGIDRQHDFFKIEAKYRVALTELAADGGMVASAPPPAKKT